MCCLETSASTYIPRLRTNADGMKSSVPIWIPDCGIWCCRQFDEHHSTSVCAEFNRSRFDCIQIVTSSTQADMRFWNCILMSMDCMRRKSAHHRRIGNIRADVVRQVFAGPLYAETRLVTCLGIDVDAPHRTNCVRSLRYDDIHFKTVPSRPYVIFRRCSNVTRLTLFNVAERSMSASRPTARFLASMAFQKSESTFNTTVSVD